MSDINHALQAHERQLHDLDKRVTVIESELTSMHDDIRNMSKNVAHNADVASQVLLNTEKTKAFAKGASWLFGVLTVVIGIGIAIL